jgi:transglutaminase-like putative cysteine protease
MMEAARSLGLAARFVSGYIFVLGRDPGAGGDGATHAWLQVYLPGAGWVDFDPTNNIVGNRNLIRVAVAWDPRQVLPLWGSFTSSSASSDSMTIEVSVTDESSAPAPTESDLAAGVQSA